MSPADNGHTECAIRPGRRHVLILGGGFAGVYLKQIKQTIQTLGRLPEEPVPEAVREEPLRRFRNWKK